MESNLQSGGTQSAETSQKKGFNADTTPSGAIVGTNQPSEPDEQWNDFVEPIKDVLSQFPAYVNGFYGNNREIVNAVGLVVLAAIAVKFTLAILDAINDIPLMAPLLELVGLGYTIWFVSRYLLQAQTRGELAQEFDGLKKQVVGSASKDS